MHLKINKGSHIQRRSLVIEPTQLYQSIFRHVLINFNIEVDIVGNGHDALECVNSKKYHLIFLAMKLPDTDGSMLCAKFRAMPQTMNVPIIMLNSGDNNPQLQKALVSGGTEVFHTSELKELGIYLDHFIIHTQDGKFQYGKILYIEENITEAIETQRLLESAGYGVSHYSNVKDAFNELLSGHYDIILTDILLEGNKTVYIFIRDIQRLPGRYAEIPILAISSSSDMQRKIELLKSGVSDYIQKPVLDEELLARVQNLVNMRHLLDQVEHQRAEMRDLAMHDQLTGLYNRHF